MTSLYLVRHGETAWNREGRFQGWLDSPLTERGRAHAHTNGELLGRLGVDSVWASPLGRVRETVGEIVKHLSVEARFDDRLKECNVGGWEGQTFETIRNMDPADWEARGEDLFNHRPPGGESLAEVQARVTPFLRALLPLGGERVSTDRVAIVSHGLMTRVILRVVLGADVIDVARTATPNDGVYRVVWQDGVPEVSHFLAGTGPVAGLIPRRR